MNGDAAHSVASGAAGKRRKTHFQISAARKQGLGCARRWPYAASNCAHAAVSALADQLGDIKGGAAKKDYVILPQNLSVEPLALGIRKGEASLKAVVDDTLRGLEKSGEANKAFVKWCGPATNLKFD